MTNKKSTKRTLLVTALSLLMCVTMLIGTTFAWFTDSATTGVNTIQSGKLDVVLEMLDGEEWVKADGKTLEFVKGAMAAEGEAVLWEPGCTYKLPKLRISNAGNLALKFDVVITGIDGDAKLNEVIDWTYTYTSDMAIDADPTELSEVNIIKHGNGYPLLPADKADQANNISYAYLTISGKMQETAGNEYQGLTINGISITVLATQYTYESDSNNSIYDITATYPISEWDGTIDTEGLAANTDDTAKIINIETAAQLAAFASAVNAGNTYAGYTINQMANIDLNNIDWTPIGATNGETMDSYPSYTFKGTYNGNGLTISNLSVESKGTNAVAGLFGSANRATIMNIVVDGANIKSEHYAAGILAYETEYSNVIGCTVKNATIISSTNGTHDNGDKAGGIVGAMTGANADYVISGNTVDNCTIIAYRDFGGIIGTAGNDLRVEDNTVIDTTIVQDVSDDYKDPTPTTVGEIVGRGAPALKNNKIENTKVILANHFVTSQDKLNEAFSGSNTVGVYLAPGTYTLPNLANKTVTISGAKDTVIDLTSGMPGSANADITFDGVTVKFLEGGNYGTNGFTHSTKVVYKDCTLINTQFLYASDGTEFINCTFEIKGDAYSVWTYGTNAIFTDCTFNCDGKAVLVYTEAAVTKTVAFNNCVFNDNGGVNGKAAIEIAESAYGNKANYTININNCTVNGFDVTGQNASTFGGTDLGTTVWGNKNLMPADRLNVVINGTEVY